MYSNWIRTLLSSFCQLRLGVVLRHHYLSSYTFPVFSSSLQLTPPSPRSSFKRAWVLHKILSLLRACYSQRALWLHFYKGQVYQTWCHHHSILNTIDYLYYHGIITEALSILVFLSLNPSSFIYLTDLRTSSTIPTTPTVMVSLSILACKSLSISHPWHPFVHLFSEQKSSILLTRNSFLLLVLLAILPLMSLKTLATKNSLTSGSWVWSFPYAYTSKTKTQAYFSLCILLSKLLEELECQTNYWPKHVLWVLLLLILLSS